MRAPGLELRKHNFLQSPPCPVHMSGWKSDTYSLHMAGWSVSMEQDIHRNRLRLGLKHEGMNVIAYGDDIHHDYRKYAYKGDQDRPEFVINQFHSKTAMVRLHGQHNPLQYFSPVDATPQIVSIDTDHRLEDLLLFAPAAPEDKHIIVEEKDVMSLLDEIKRIQMPQQAELREKHRRQPQSSRVVTHANIISINRAA